MAEGKTMMKTQFVTKMASLLVQGVDLISRDRNCVLILHQALRDKVECVVDTLLEEGVSANAKDDEGFSALYHAFRSKSVKMMDKVVQKGARIDEFQESGKTVLHLALQEKIENVVDFLLENGASVTLKDCIVGNSSLYYAITSGQANLVSKVIDKGANLNDEFQGKRKSPVHIAVENNFIDILRLLLERHADPNKLDNTQCSPLQYAVKNDHIDMAKALLVHGATTEVKHGQSMLHSAKLSVGMVRLLIQHGEQVNASNTRGETLLIIASTHGLKEVVQELLDKGAEVNHRDINGRTALHHAATEKVVVLLVQKGADVNATDADGNTPLIWSFLQEKSHTTEALLLYGSKVDVKNKSGQNFVLLYQKLDQRDQYFKIVTEYIIKLKLAKLEENLTNRFLFNMCHFREFEALCSAELNRLKVARQGCSLYDVLSDKNNDCSILKNKLLVMKIKSEALESEYPIYCSLLRNSLRKIIKRDKFATTAKLTMTVSVGRKSATLNLPDYMINQLIETIPDHVIDILS